MNIKKFEVLEELSQFTDSMLFDSDLIIAEMDCEINGHKINVDLRTAGSVRVHYKDDIYRYPSEFPEELVEKIKKDKWWDCDKDVLVDEINWFEFVYHDTYDGDTFCDGVVCEDDVSKFTEEELKNRMIKICKWIVEE